jgi:hypothetical protein
MQLLIELGVAPALAALATLAADRWGARAGGIVSAFPAVVGPVLLVDALEHGTAFAARAANGTLLGLVALSAFAVGYGRVALTRGWPLSLAVGWWCAAVSALLIGLWLGGAGAPVGLMVAGVSLIAADRLLRRPSAAARKNGQASTPARSAVTIAVRMAMTALLVTVLAAAAGRLGPTVGGMLAALPVLASVLAVLAHREAGGETAVAWLRGMLQGMSGFVVFCEVVALLIRQYGIAPALAAAAFAALAIQAAAAWSPTTVQRAV